ncbi:unnamed protein product, partial [Prorocentrum cordatum]
YLSAAPGQKRCSKARGGAAGVVCTGGPAVLIPAPMPGGVCFSYCTVACENPQHSSSSPSYVFLCTGRRVHVGARGARGRDSSVAGTVQKICYERVVYHVGSSSVLVHRCFSFGTVFRLRWFFQQPPWRATSIGCALKTRRRSCDGASSSSSSSSSSSASSS